MIETILTGLVGVITLAVIYLALPVSTPRFTDKQKKTQATVKKGTGHFVEGKDEDGKPLKYHHGDLVEPELSSFTEAKIHDNSFIVCQKEGKGTLYEMISKPTTHDNRPCFGTCVKGHVYADALAKDGTPNKKPMIVSTPGVWTHQTYGSVKDTARRFGSCLRKVHNIGQGEKISLWAPNSAKWMTAEMACHAFNFVTVSVYDTLGPDAASFITADASCKVLCVGAMQFSTVAKTLEDEVYAKNPARALEVVVCFDKPKDFDAVKAKLDALKIKVLLWEDAIKTEPIDVTPPKATDMATIMYTSGTTGNPKGVKLTHMNLVSTVGAANNNFHTSPDDVHLSYLPLAHIFEREVQYGCLAEGACINFSSNLDRPSAALLPDLSVIRPTIFAGVPKVFESVRDAVERKMTGFKATLFKKAKAAKIADIETGCGYARLWDVLLFSKTKKALGGRVRFCITGGAPISKDTLQFVVCALAPVMQGYGATETAAAATLTDQRDMELGHVGPPLGHSVIKLVDAPTMNYFAGPEDAYPKGSPGNQSRDADGRGRYKNGGEIWIRGAGVSPGYYDGSVDSIEKKKPPTNGMAKKTAEDFLMEDGFNWFKTGDVGVWNNGRMRVIDRVKNMYKLSIGEYVPVEQVEKTYQDTCNMVDFVFVPKETKVGHIAVCVVIADSIGVVMKWAKGVPALADKSEKQVVDSDEFKKELCTMFLAAAKDKKLQPFLRVPSPKNIHTEFQPIGYQETWVTGVECAGHMENLLTATFKARRAQLDLYFGKKLGVYKKIYPDRPADHVLP